MATASEPEPRTVPKVCDLHSTPVAVLLIAAAAILVEMAVSTWYGNHRDELYFLRCGDHLAWRFVNQPPFTPALARLATVVAGGALPVVRLFPALSLGGLVFIGAIIARELGARRYGQRPDLDLPGLSTFLGFDVATAEALGVSDPRADLPSSQRAKKCRPNQAHPATTPRRPGLVRITLRNTAPRDGTRDPDRLLRSWSASPAPARSA
jgi:hypothetical protein